MFLESLFFRLSYSACSSIKSLWSFTIQAYSFSQAVKQKVDESTNQVAGVAEQLTNRQQQHPAASHAADDTTDESVVMQRLRKVELTVAGKI